MPGEDDARAQMLEFLLREMDFYLDALNSLRTTLSALTGLGITVVLALAGLAFRDGRQPPKGIVIAGSVSLLGAVVFALVVISRIRKAVEWPEGDLLVQEQPGSVVDLRERYVLEFATKLKRIRERTNNFDSAYLVVLVGTMFAACMWVVALAQTSPPAQLPKQLPPQPGTTITSPVGTPPTTTPPTTTPPATPSPLLSTTSTPGP